MRDGAGIAAFALRKSMIGHMPAEDLACIDGHRAVEEYRDVRQASGSLQTVQVEQEALCSPHGECRDDHRSAPSNRATDNFRKSILGIPRVVPAISIGRLNNNIVGFRNRNRIDHGGVVVAAEIAGEENGVAVPVKLDGSRAQDVTRSSKQGSSAPGEV